MLQQIRDKITGWFATVFLGAIAVVFIFWGIRFESGPASTAAKVNGESISVGEVRKAWQQRQSELQQATRDELPESVVKAEQKKLIDDFVNRAILDQHTHEMGYRVTDTMLAKEIESIPALQVDGRFDRDRYAALLRQQGRSEADFEVEYRKELEVQQLRRGIAVSSFVTPGELGRRIALEGETRDADWFVLAAAPFESGVVLTPAQVQAWYDAHKSDFMTPETVSLQFVELKAADVAAGVTVTDEGLRQYYEQVAPERYVEPERRRARHVLIEAGGDDAAAKKTADEVAAKAKAGADFAALAKQYSADPGSKDQGGELGWATRDAYVPEFANAVFSMQAGEVSAPVKTQFGWHVIQLEEVQPSHQRTFDEVRAELEADYRNDQAQSLFYEKSQQLADDAFASLNELESVAKKNGLAVQTVDVYTRQGGGPFGKNARVIEAVFSDTVLEERQNSPAVTVNDGDVVILRVTDHKPSAQRPLDEVRGEIEAALRKQGAAKAAEAAAIADAASITAGQPIAAVAKGAGVAPAGSRSVGRAAEGVDPALLKAVFRAQRPVPGGAVGGTAVLANGDVAVFAVTAVRAGVAPTGDSAAFELMQVAQKAAGASGVAEFAAYVKELEARAKITINPNVFGSDDQAP
ncbi:MAG: SurA N-terminal domain-containing protein [Steroidobacteraceae bacterium]